MTDELRDQLKERPTAELVAILREHDLEEWREEVFPVVEAILQDRGVNTTALKVAGPARRHTVEPSPLESVASFGSPVEADLCRMALLEAGIKAWLSTEDLGGMVPPLGWAAGVEVLVRREDARVARELLAAVEAGAAEIPDDPVTCPRCASADTERSGAPGHFATEPGRQPAETPGPMAGWRWKCAHCGHEWL